MKYTVGYRMWPLPPVIPEESSDLSSEPTTPDAGAPVATIERSLVLFNEVETGSPERHQCGEVLDKAGYFVFMLRLKEHSRISLETYID